MYIDWTIWVITWAVCGVIGAGIAEYKNRSAVLGFVLGALLTVIGIAIVALLPKKLPTAPPGFFTVKCPHCNAVDEIPVGDHEYNCWQCFKTSDATDLPR